MGSVFAPHILDTNEAKEKDSDSRQEDVSALPAFGQMIAILTEFGVESRLEKEDYLQGIRNLRKVW